MKDHEYYRCQLNPQARLIYDYLLGHISRLASTGRVEVPVRYNKQSVKDAVNAYRALRIDRPEYFFLENSFKTCNTPSGTLVVQQNLKYSMSHILRLNRVLRRTVREIIAGTENMPALKREKVIYRRIGKMYSYKNDAYAHDLTGLLVFKSGVCESMAGMLVVALREAGIPAVAVHGFGTKSFHRWNKVWIDGKEYYLDVTWDLDNCRNGRRLKYFNRSFNQMAPDHQIRSVFLE